MAAIYMWPKDNYLILTTTLYPVDVTDSMVMSVEFTGGFMSPLPAAEVSGIFGPGPDGVLEQLRWFYSDGPYDNEVAGTFGPGDEGELIQLRWFYTDGPYDNEVSGTFGVGPAGDLRQLIIYGDTPDESLQLAVTVNDTCTMDAV
jgi:hypothetical protein